MTSAQAARCAGLALLLFACSSSDEAETAQPAATAAQGGASAGAGGPAAGPAGKTQAGDAGDAGAAQGSAGKPASAGSGGSAGQGNAGSDAGGAGGAMAGSPASGGAGGQAAGGEAASGQAGAGGIAPVCQPGKQEACACPGTTETGVQVCEPSGQSWGPCAGCPGGEAGSAGASPTGGAGGAGAGGSPAECTEGQHQGCECPIAGEWALQWCQADGSWGPCEGCPDYPVPVEGVDYNLCEDANDKVGRCADETVSGRFGCVEAIDDNKFAEWIASTCSIAPTHDGRFCCNVPSACDRVAVNMIEPGVVLTCAEYEAETGVKVSSSPCKTAGKVCSVVRPALSACWTMCVRSEAEQKCPSAVAGKCEATGPFELGGEGAFSGCCNDI